MSRAPRRLSRSVLWDVQRRWFDEQGVVAWNESVVPQYVTSNPWIADAYAAVMSAWLRDLAGTGAVDRAAPLYVLELGCGSGRFGFHFLRRLLEELEGSSLHDLPLRYVYTDFTDSNLDVLRSNVAVQPFVAAGRLDFARFDAGRDRTLQLDGGDVLDASTLHNPLAVIANYVFDGLPQDAFRVSAGVLEESLVRDDPHARSVEDAIATWQHRRADAATYYDDPSWNEILEGYRANVRRAGVVFPTSALRCLADLHDLSRGRLLVLSADKGCVHEEVIAAEREPELAFHGSVSMMVNYHAIGKWVEGRGGAFLRPSLRTTSLTVAACLFGGGQWEETRLAFARNIDRRGPDDFFAMKLATQQHYDAMTLEQLLAWLRLSGWDHHVFLDSLPVLRDRGRRAEPIEREELRRAARLVADTWFPLHEPPDLPFHAGTLLMDLGDAADALELFERSLALFGPRGTTLVNMAVCCTRTGDGERALAYAREAVELEPQMDRARELLASLRA
jgi:SAM-dependent methyltransferase